MKRAPCTDDAQRLKTLESYGIVDTPREKEFDEITQLASHICEAPVAIVSLVTADRQWFKSEVGLGCDETPLDVSICSQAILEPDMLIVPDTTKDPRFANNRFVTGEPYLRFYAGAQLRTPDGYALGTLCVLDTRQRTLSRHQIQSLEMLASQVMHLLELRRTLNHQAEMTSRLRRHLEEYRLHRRMASHDLRSPLTTVHLAAQQLTINPDDETTAQLAEHVLHATEKMTHLIEDLLGDPSAPTSRPDACSANKLLHDTFSLFEMSAHAAGLELHIKVDESLPAVRCDSRRTFQILNNLVSNALKFTPPGNQITMTARPFGDEVLFEIEDTGPGIPEEELEHVFESYWRSPTAEEDGTGLGLAIARRLVESQQGRIGVESIFGEGTVFWFTLPRASSGNKVSLTHSRSESSQ